MSKTVAIRGALVALLETLPEVGIVHSYERYAPDMKKLKEIYVADGILSGWFVRRHKQFRFGGPGAVDVRTVWRIRGYRALSDEAQSELIFDASIDAIAESLQVDSTLGGVCAFPPMDAEFGGQLIESGPVMFAGVLCHAASIEFTTRHFE